MAGPLYDLGIAQQINRAHGGPVIAAWQVGQLDEGTISLYTGMAWRLPKMRAAAQAVEKRLAELRADFYRRQNLTRH